MTVRTMLQKGEEYCRIPFFVAGITFVTGIVDRRVSCKNVRDPQHVGESPSLSRQAKRNSLNRESVESGRVCLFVEGVQYRDKNLPHFRPIAPRIADCTTAPYTMFAILNRL